MDGDVVIVVVGDLAGVIPRRLVYVVCFRALWLVPWTDAGRRAHVRERRRSRVDARGVRGCSIGFHAMQCAAWAVVQDEEGLGTSVTGRGIYTMMDRRDT